MPEVEKGSGMKEGMRWCQRGGRESAVVWRGMEKEATEGNRGGVFEIKQAVRGFRAKLRLSGGVLHPSPSGPFASYPTAQIGNFQNFTNWVFAPETSPNNTK